MDANRPRIGGARFCCYSNEGSEPPHILIEQAGAVAKFWLDSVSLPSSSRFSARELQRLERKVEEHCDPFLEAWHDYFGAWR